MSVPRRANFVLRFLLDLAARVAVAYWGWTAGDGLFRVVLAIAGFAAMAIVWSLLFAPRPTIELPGAARLALEVLFWVVAGAALSTTGHRELGVAFVVVAVASSTLNHVWQRAR